jgi:glycosyltransferase involved in cell wall biosynthesis
MNGAAMKVLYVMRNMWGGGAPKRFWRIHEHIIKDYDVNIDLLTTLDASTFRKPSPNDINQENISILPIRLNRFSDYLFYLSANLIVKKIGKHYDLIHDDFSPVGPHSYIWHKKTLATFHEVQGDNSLQRYGLPGLFTTVNERFASKSGYLYHIVPAPSVASKFKKLGVSASVIPGGVDTDFYNPGYNKKNEDLITITMISRFVPAKGHLDFLHMAKEVSKVHKNVRFVLPGAGPIKENVMDLARKLKLNIEFPGFLQTDQDIVSLLQQSNVYVSTSYSEGFGISVCEAMSCGLPIVAYDVPAIRDLIEGIGNLVPLKNISEIVKYVTQLVSDEDMRCKMASASRTRALKRYTWSKAADMLYKLYCQVVE